MSGADVGIAFLSAFLQVAFDRLAPGETLCYFQKRGLNETLVKKLKIMLISVNSVIDDAEYKQFSDPNVRAWLLELKDAVYDAEDVLDEISYELYKRKLEAEAEPQTSVTSKVRKFFNASATSFDQEIESRMKQVLESLEFLESRRIGLGLKEGKDGAVGSVTRLPTTSLVDEVGICGRDKDKDIIIKQLQNDRHFSVISIVGMGGLGKTTLAQLVYNDKRVKSEFDLRLWVYVSDDFDVLKLTKIIFKKIMASNDGTEDLDALQNKLKDWSSKKKFLIVLDDVWCDDYVLWEAFLAPFIGGVAGSRILVTSRNENVALAAPSDEIYHPNHLSDDELNIKQLGELNLQGQLSIHELQNVVHGMDALQANLNEKRYLEELRFGWNKDTNDDSQNERDVLEKLRPHQNLKKLSVEYYGGTRFPDWFADNTLSSVVELQLKSCKYCFVLPSLGLLPSLKSLVIEKLDGIVAIGAEFLGSDCSIVPFRSLENLELGGMVNWEEWDCTTASRAFPRLEELCIRNCPKLKENLPEQLLSLDDLVIEDCPQLVALVPRASTIQRLTLKNCGNVRLEYIPSTLKALRFRGPCMNVSLLKKIEQTINNSCIEEVAICDCPDWEFPLKQHHDSLRHIQIVRSCGSLGTFALDQFPALEGLYLSECNNVETISISEGCNHGNLEILRIEKCPKFVSFPEEGYSAPRLKSCYFEDLEDLKSVPGHINIFAPSLSDLSIIDCAHMESLPEGGLPSKLTHLSISKCPKLFACRLQWGLHDYDFLRELFISGDDVVESLPEPGLLPTSLISLYISDCTNLRMLDYKALCESPCLKYLAIVNCPRLQCLPTEGLPSSISWLQIGGDCPALKQRCQKPEGEDWERIAHIRGVYIY